MTCAAIVLAAGDSTRMGQQKITLPFNGVTVIEHIVQTLERCGLGKVVVVVGRDAAEIRAALRGCSVNVVDNPDYQQGMLTSVRAGLRALGDEMDAALVCLGDQPSIQPSVVRAVIECGASSPSDIVVPGYEGKRGHPLLIPSEYWKSIVSSYDDVGLRGLLQEYSSKITDLPGEESWVLDDMDYPEDYQRELKRLENDQAATQS